MRRFLITAIFCSLICSAQVMKVPLESLGERLIAVVPMVGKGTVDDPVRPKYTPIPMTAALQAKLTKEGKLRLPVEKTDTEKIAEDRLRIGAFSYVLSDDGKSAIVEFVARDRAAFSEILKDSGVKAHPKSKLNDAAVIDDLKKVKKSFSASTLRTVGY